MEDKNYKPSAQNGDTIGFTIWWVFPRIQIAKGKKQYGRMYTELEK